MTKRTDKRATRSAQQAASLASTGGLLAIGPRDFGKLLKSWGWVEALSTESFGSHTKYRWNGHQVNFHRQAGRANAMSRIVAERAAAVMGMTVKELLTGPTMDNPGVAKAMAAANIPRERWAETGDRLHTDPSFRVPWDEGDDLGYEIDLTADLVELGHEVDLDLTAPPPSTPSTPSTYPTACPVQYCGKVLDQGECSTHGRPLVCPLTTEAVSPYHLDAFLAVRYIDLTPQQRRTWLDVKRRLEREGLITPEDNRPLTPADLPHTPLTGKHVAGTANAVIPKKETNMLASDAGPNSPRPNALKSPPVPFVPQRPKKGTPMSLNRSKKVEDRVKDALPIGTARTIDQVLARTNGSIYPVRRQVLEALVKHGDQGMCSSGDGRASAKLLEWVKRDHPESGHLHHALRVMEQDGQITRTQTPSGKATYLISVLDPLDVEYARFGKVSKASVKVDDEVEKTEPAQTTTTPAQTILTPEDRLLKAFNLTAPEPPILTTPTPTPTPPAAIVAAPATLTLSTTDEDLFDLLDLLLGPRKLVYGRDTIPLFNAWANATRDIIAKSIEVL